MKKSYTAVVKGGKLILNETTNLPDGTTIELVELSSSHRSLTHQIKKVDVGVKQAKDAGSIQNVGSIEDVISETIEIADSVIDKIAFEEPSGEFNLHELLMQGIQAVNYTTPTLIQQQAIQPIIDKKDILGIAKTGSGKTAAFALPIMENLIKANKYERLLQVLIVTPTRELALQIGESFDTYGKFTKLKQITIFGGVSQRPQVKQLKNRRAQILIATPGRLLDLMNQNFISLDHISTLVLDEADRMLDMGFRKDLNRIVASIPHRDQTLLFSATMPDEIFQLAKKFLKEEFVHVTGDQTSIPIDKIQQEIYFVEKENKLPLLEYLLVNENISKALIFTRTKYGADKLVRKLKKQTYTIEAMHGNKSQQARQRALSNFKSNKTQILVATDLAARGLDVDDISHVINYDLSSEPETYMHRIGRTARAGKTGIAISFCQKDQRKYFTLIEQLLDFHIPRAIDNPFQSNHDEPLLSQLGKKTRYKKKLRGRGKSSNRSRKRHSKKFKN